MRRLFIAFALLAPLAAFAQLPRLVPFLQLSADANDPRGSAIEPIAYWSHDGLLCVPSPEDATRDECHDTVTGAMRLRKRQGAIIPPLKSLTLNGTTFANDGTITNGQPSRVAKLRCARSPYLDRKDYRYVLGAEGLLAVLVLEQDDRQIRCAKADAQCPHEIGPLWWRVLTTKAECPAEEPRESNSSQFSSC